MNNLDKSFFKKQLIYLLIFILYIYIIKIFLIQPISQSIGTTLSTIDSDLNKNFLYFELIDNPLTFIKFAEYYKNKGNIEKALISLDYAEVSNAIYKSKLIDKKIEVLRSDLSKSK